ncbi:MAG: VanZ family protein [Magnetococcales bacterium]|nr:VanZ family protein [Magnetococcales bacterium]
MNEDTTQLRNSIESENSIWAWFWAVALIVYCGWIFYLSSGPIEVKLPEIAFFDLVLHAGAYGIMGFIGWQAFSRQYWVDKPLLWSWGYATVYGFSDELHQYFVPGRFSTIEDWIADSVGAALMLTLIHLWLKRETH